MKVVLLFPGYGSQFVGMGKELYDEYRVVQEYFEEAAQCLNMNFVKLCFASSDAELSKMGNAYTATFLISCSIAALLKEQGIVPCMAAGISFGEFAAIHAAGGMSFPDGLYLLNKFATFYQESLETMPVGALRVTKIVGDDLQALCQLVNKMHERVDVAVYTAHGDYIVSGTHEALEALKQQLAMHTQAKVVEAPIEYGLHSPLMEPVAKLLRLYLEKVDFKDLAFPVLSNLDAKNVASAAEVKKHVINQLLNPVRWPDTIEQLAGYDLYIEVGPGTALAGMVKEKYPDKLVVSVNKITDLKDLKKLVEPSQESKDPHGSI